MLGSKSMRRSEGRKRWCRTLALPPNRKMAFQGGALPLLSAPHESGKSLRQAVARIVRRRQPGRGQAAGDGGEAAASWGVAAAAVAAVAQFGFCMFFRTVLHDVALPHTHAALAAHSLLNASLSECRVQWPRGKVPSNSRKQVNKQAASRLARQDRQARLASDLPPAVRLLPSSTASCPSNWLQGDE